LRDASSEQAGAFRLRVWRDVVAMSLSSPLLGHGLGSFAEAFPRYKTSNGELRVEHAENDFLEMLAEGGLLGLGLALTAAGLAVSAIARGLRRQRDRLLRGIGIGSLAGLIALLVHSAFDFNLRIPSNATLFALLAALALGGSAEPRPAGRTGSRVFGLLLLAGTAAALWPGGRSIESARRSLRAALAIADPASRSLRQARAEAALMDRVRQCPADAEAWFLLGWSRAVMGRAEGLALARYGTELDPTRSALASELRRLAAARGATP
jgi:O-Antigen ligase